MANEQLTIIGPSSRLAQALGIRSPGREYSIRPGSAALPEEIDGTILVFADPPSVEATRNALLDVTSRIRLNARAHLILISSISAGNGASTIYPHEGQYARRKRLAEDIVASRSDLAVTVIRVGNVAEYGGWQDIFSNCRTALLPREASHVAVASIEQLRERIGSCALEGSGGRFDAYSLVPAQQCFGRVLWVPGLLSIYKSGAMRIPLKIVAKLLRRAGVYLPSPDDLNAFLMGAR